jgi:hypothetical protein
MAGGRTRSRAHEAGTTTQIRRFAITISDASFTITGSPAILARRGTDDMSMQLTSLIAGKLVALTPGLSSTTSKNIGTTYLQQMSCSAPSIVATLLE